MKNNLKKAIEDMAKCLEENMKPEDNSFMTNERLQRSLTNITPSSEQVKRMEAIREMYKKTGVVVNDLCKNSEYKKLAITNLEQSLMWVMKTICMEESDV